MLDSPTAKFNSSLNQ